MSNNPEALRTLVQDRLGESLQKWVEQRRARGQSWASIGSELRMTTEISVTNMTVWRWFHPREKDPKTQ